MIGTYKTMAAFIAVNGVLEGEGTKKKLVGCAFYESSPSDENPEAH